MTDNPIYIIGNTATAYALAAKLTLAGENILVMSGRDSERFSAPFLLREDNMLQKNKITIPTALMMRQPAKMVIFDAKPDDLKSLLTCFSPAKAADCPLISLCHTSNTTLIAQILRRPPIPAVFNGWITLHANNTITILGHKNELAVALTERSVYFETVRNTLAKTYFDLTFSPDEKQNFWNFFIPFAACSLFSLEYGKNIRDISKFPERRAALNLLLDEIIATAPAEISVNKEQILSSIYSTPNNYVYPIIEDMKEHLSGELLFIAETLRRNEYPRLLSMPETQKIIRKHLQKNLSSVE